MQNMRLLAKEIKGTETAEKARKTHPVISCLTSG